MTMIQRFKERAEEMPEQEALVFCDHRYTYRELDRMTDRLAAALGRRGIGRGDVVSVLVPRSEYMVMAALGVLKAGGAYQPLAPSYPEQRIQYMVEDAGSSLLIAAKEYAGMAEGLPVEWMAVEEIDRLPQEDGFELPEICPDDLFVLLYTSGSTGEPKGCMLDHKNICSFADWYMVYYEADETCRMAEYASFVFDVSLMEMFMPLTVGAAVYIVPEEIRADLSRLNEFFERNGITHTSMTTRIGRQFALQMENHSLRHLTVAGEALGPLQPPENYKLHNGYGPTEGTILLTVQPVERLYEDGVPIGSPLDQVEIYVLDEDGHPAAEGEPGELCAAGPHITQGYRNKSEQTALVFEKNPFSDKKGYETIYHTGDLVRYGQDGLLMYMGRKDRQVKIRGYRMEPSEVEMVMRQSGLVKDAAVTAIRLGDERYLAAYYVAGQECRESRIRAFLMERIPEYMVPSFFVRLDVIPLNINGKVDFESLPLPDRNQGREVYERPQNAEEEKLARLYEELLGIDHVGREDHFLRLGGHSLLAAELLFRIEGEFGCTPGIGEVMAHLTVRELAECVRNAEVKPDCQMAYDSSGHVYRASAAQRRMYTAQMMCKEGDRSYHLPVILHISGNSGRINRGSAAAKLAEMFRRHDSMRTEFHRKENDLVQDIRGRGEEWIRHAVEESYIELEERRAQDNTASVLTSFDMGKAPLFHWGYKETAVAGGNEIQILFDWHHSISDGISAVLFCQEFMALLCGEGQVGLPSFQYKDFAQWEAGLDWDNERRAWAGHLPQGEIPVLDLCLDHTRTAQPGHRGGHVAVTLSGEASDRIRNICREHMVTEYTFLFAAFFVLLHKYTGQEEMIAGTVMSGRMREEWRQVQGMFANTLPVVAEIREEETFQELLEQVRDELFFVMEHQSCPLEEIAGAAGAERLPSGNILFDVMFVMQGLAEEFAGTAGGQAELEFVTTGTAMYDLTLEAVQSRECYQFDFEYNSDLFARESIQVLAQHFLALVLACAGAPEQKLKDISFLTGAEKTKLLVEFQGETGGAEEKAGRMVMEAFVSQAARNPGKTALVFGDDRMTYGQLDRATAVLAGRLAEYGIWDRFAVVYAGRGFGMVASIFGVLRAGGAYVPVSPAYPDGRIRTIFEDCQPSVILVSEAELSAAIRSYAEEKHIPVIEVRGEDLFGNARVERRGRMPLPGQLAYMIYTSGTTGIPKGVMVEHKQLAHLLEAYTEIYQLEENDCVLQFANFVFDQSVWDIFHILTVGGTLCLIPEEITRDPEGLEKYCQDKRVTAASLTPGLLSLLHPDRMPSLRLLDVGGEAPGEELLLAWSKGRRVFNTYGPTETTVNASSFLFDGRVRKSGRVPIGRAIPDTQIYIMQGEELAGICVPGELCIAGAGVTRGYWNREELTEKKYVKNLFGEGRMYRSGDLARYLPDGNIEFLGRMDEQVKVHGYRIEPAEIEAQMRAGEQVKEAVAVVKKTAAGESVLCGYYTAETDLAADRLRRQLEDSLPYYMVPSALVLLDELPLTMNGKVNKKALPEPIVLQKRGGRKPETEKESLCAAVWEEVLEIPSLGTDCDFFEYGGDSIRAIRIVSKLRDLGYQTDVGDILSCRTVRALARRLVYQEEGYDDGESAEVLPTPVIQGFLEAGMPYPEHYNQSVLLEWKGRAQGKALCRALERLEGCHGMLRLQWNHNAGKERLVIRPESEMPPVECLIRHFDEADEMLERCRELHREICPGKGRMFRAELFRGRETDYLFLGIHHLAVDEVSWEILLEDLDTLYREEWSSLSHTISFGRWTWLLREYGRTDAFEREREAWKWFGDRESLDGRIAGYLGEDRGKACGFGVMTRMLTGSTGEALRELAEKKYHTRLDAVLLAGLSWTVRELTNVPELVVWMEGHGRGKLHCPVRTDRTVGWFTAVYPVLVEGCEDLSEQIAFCKELLIHVPNEGMGYGIWRQQEGRKVCQPGIVLNYLGQGRRREFGEFTWPDWPSWQNGEEMDADNGDSRTVSLDIREGKTGLEIVCRYDTCFSSERICALLDRYQGVLRHIAAELSGSDAVTTPSDLCAGTKMSWKEWHNFLNMVYLPEVEAVCPLTPVQRGMLYRRVSDPESPAYHILDRVSLAGEWKPHCLREGWKLAAERYDVLRSRFLYEGLEQPWQIILRKPEITFILPEETLDMVAQKEKERGFDFAREPLFRIYAFAAGDEGAELLISWHHIILDGWSFSLILDSFHRYFRLLCSGVPYEEVHKQACRDREQSCSFAEYAAWRDSQGNEKGISYWQGYLDGYEGQSELEPFWKPEAARGEERLAYRIPEPVETALRDMAKAHGFTMSVVLETAWGILLQRENSCRDVVFGRIVSGRNICLPGADGVAGPLIHTVPVRVTSRESMRFVELLERQQERAVESMQFELMDWEELQKETDLGKMGTLVVYENYYIREQGDQDFASECLWEETDVPVTLCVEEESGGIRLNLFWDAARYKKVQMEKQMERLMFILEQMIRQGDETMGALDLIPPLEKDVMTGAFSGEWRDYPKKTIVSLLEHSFREFAGKEAAVWKGGIMTYQGLHLASLQLAERIGSGGERYVAVVAERGFGRLAALCGVLYAGAAYVPIDPDCPWERVRYMLEDCQPSAVVTSLSQGLPATLARWLEENHVPSYPAVWQDFSGENAVSAAAGGPVEDLTEVLWQDSELWNRAAYVIYTSGTTGRPKGVVMEHHALSNMIYSNQEFYHFCREDRVLQLANYVFDQSVMDIFNTLAAGGTLCLISEEEMRTAEGIEQYCTGQNVSVLISTSAMLGTLHPEKLGTLRLLDVGGDTASGEMLDCYDKAELVSNSYGPTETAVNATAFRYSRRDESVYGYRSVPIGRPLGNKKIYVMQGNRLCGIGMQGEICIAGGGLAREYLHQKELTEKCFTSDPYGGGRIYRSGDLGRYLPDGNLEFRGRMDRQVKIRGIRIEPGEVEECLRKISGVREAAVVCVQECGGWAGLSGFVVLEEEWELASVRDELQRMLPSYMIPSRLQRVEHLPLNRNGKLDEEKLKALDKNRDGGYEAPVTYYEKIAARQFEKILNIPKAGRKDSFFSLGGTSLDVMKLASELMPYRIGIQDLAVCQTPEKIGNRMEERLRASEESHIVEKGHGTGEGGFLVLREGDRKFPALYCLPPSGGTVLCYQELLEQWDYPGTVYGMADPKYLKYAELTTEKMRRKAEETENIRDMWQETLAVYEEELMKVWRDGGILAGYSQGGSIALRLASRLEERGYYAGALLMLEAVPISAGEQPGAEEEAISILRQMFPSYLSEWKEGAVLQNQEEVTRILLAAYLVVKQNIAFPLVTEGQVHCPVYSVQIESGDRPHGISWQEYTLGTYTQYDIPAEEGDHLVFLSKYKEEISGVLHSLDADML